MGFLEEVVFNSGLRGDLKDQQVQFSFVPDEEKESQREHTVQCGCASQDV